MPKIKCDVQIRFMKKSFLISELERLMREQDDPETNKDMEKAHMEADELLLRYINDEEIRRAFETIPRGYQ